MRRLALCILIGLGATALSGADKFIAPVRTIFTGQDLAALDRISAYLNRVKSLESGFIQLGPNGQLDEGRLYISKPGRMRFEYRPPNPVLVVSDGSTVAVKNSRLNTVDRYSLSNTPLSLILGNDVDLARDGAVTRIARQDGTYLVYARSTNNKTQGNIILVFSEPDIELRQWSITDSQGKTTTVTLRDTVTGKPVDQAKFVLPVKDAEPKKNPG